MTSKYTDRFTDRQTDRYSPRLEMTWGWEYILKEEKNIYSCSLHLSPVTISLSYDLFGTRVTVRSCCQKNLRKHFKKMLKFSICLTLFCLQKFVQSCLLVNIINIMLTRNQRPLFCMMKFMHQYKHKDENWLCCKNKFLSSVPYLNLLKSCCKHCPDSAIQ